MDRARNIGHNVLSSVSESFHNVADRLSTKVALGGLAVTAVATLAPPIAEAKIVEGHSIGKVSLGQTKGQVKHELGKPWEVQDSGVGQDSNWTYLDGHRVTSYQVSFNRAGKVVQLSLDNASQKTRKGIGVSSTVGAVKRAYPGISKSLTITGKSKNGDTVRTFFQHNRRQVTGVEIVDLTALIKG